jgi:rod shape-determining protein MreB and related proteins
MVNFLNRILASSRKVLAMDLGTANILISNQRDGIVLNEPSIVALDKRTQKILAIGQEARDYLGRTPPHIHAVRPLRQGVIADFDTTQMMIGYFIRKVLRRRGLIKPLIVIGVPTGITHVEKRAVVQAGMQVGAGEIKLIEEPMAAALGAGLPVDEAMGSMIVDVGGGTSEVAVISLSASVCSQSVRIAGDEMDFAIQRHMRDRHQLLIGFITAEKIKIRIGSAMSLKTELNMEVSGKSIVDGIPRTILIQDWEIREVIHKAVNAIVQAVLRTMEATPAALMNDISSTGMRLVGGGALLKGLDSLIAKHSSLSVIVDDDPLTTVVRGAARAMENRDKYASVFIN